MAVAAGLDRRGAGLEPFFEKSVAVAAWLGGLAGSASENGQFLFWVVKSYDSSSAPQTPVAAEEVSGLEAVTLVTGAGNFTGGRTEKGLEMVKFGKVW